MCTYNGADFLPEQLESIVAQSRPPDEIVVCDDGSTDATRALLKTFAARSPIPVSMWNHESHLGTSRNFEHAIRRCTADAIALSDQDDVWRHDKLQRIEEALGRAPTAGLVFSDAELVDERSRSLGRRLWSDIGFDAPRRRLVRRGRALEVLITGATVAGATMAFRSQFATLALPIPDEIAMIHDGWIALTIAAVADVVPLEEPLIKYRQHARQQTGIRVRARPARRPGPLEALASALRRGNAGSDVLKTLTTLEQRLAEQAGSFDTRAARAFIGDYSRHLHMRGNLPRRRPSRLPGIVRELVTLRYHRYANGLRSAAKDLVCPVQPR
jgi:glycosyltransferase involved in cell wall biosynthesis